MEGYVRFSSSSPPAGAGNTPAGPFVHHHSPSTEGSTDSAYLDSPPGARPLRHSGSGGANGHQLAGSGSSGGSGWRQRGSCGAWLPLALAHPVQSVAQLWRSPAHNAYQSNYMTLVPLSDARLRPRRTKLIVSTLLLLALLAVTGVFLLVPRGISVGTIEVHSTKMTFNSTTHTYRIILQADVPIFNPNYLKASVTGNLSVSYYDAEAGWASVGPALLRSRSNPQVLSVNVDASNLPRKYTQVVYNACFTFPRKLVFFLLGTFETRYLGYVTTLPSIDTYFVLDCSGAKD